MHPIRSYAGDFDFVYVMRFDRVMRGQFIELWQSVAGYRVVDRVVYVLFQR